MVPLKRYANSLLQDPVDITCFWVNPFGVPWPIITASDLILVNKDGGVIDGGPVRLLNSAGVLLVSDCLR